MSAHTLAPRRSASRSRRGRRASVSTSSHARLDPKLTLHAPPAPLMTSASRRHSFEPLSEHARALHALGIHPGEPSDRDDDRDFSPVKKESRSPSPSLLASSRLQRERDESSPEHEHYAETLAYASLPPSPTIPMSATPSFDETPISPRQEHQIYHAPFSIWDYLREELLATDFDSHQELKWERVSNFLNVPMAIEKTLAFGFIVCLDSFLYTFTILPIRFVLALYSLFLNFILRTSRPLPPSQKVDILRSLLIIISIIILAPLTDASKIYHSIRGQDTIKLYVIFNALEIADRLFTSFGQDILDCVFSRSTLLLLSTKVPVSSKTFRPISYFSIATAYVVAHSLVLIYQLTALNVAVNSYDHSLLTLLVSNQFVEIKGSVFKKFEKDNLFQITCADIVERFILSLMLFAVALRNLIELTGAEFDFAEGIVLPKSFGWTRGGGNLIWTILYPVFTVLVSEQIVDWLKHAFITKFNHIRPSVYERYIDVLCLDLANGSAVGRRGARKHSYVDQSPLVARRLGFPALPLAVLATIIGAQAFGIIMDTRLLFMPTFYVKVMKRAQWVVVALIAWVCCVLIKIIIGMNLISYASKRRVGMEAREDEDKVNDFGRDPIGEGKEEKQYNRDLKAYLDNRIDNASPVPEIGEKSTQYSSKSTSKGDSGSGGGRKRLKLEELTRFTMVKRIW